MLKYRQKLATCFLLIALALYPLSVLAATAETEPGKKQISPEVMTIDLLLARPLGLVSTVVGSAIFVVSLPFSAIGGNTPEAWNSLVAAPSKFTFDRPLGDFNQQAVAPEF